MISFVVGRSLGFALANFGWQWITGTHHWGLAAQLSFFQAWAIAFTVYDLRKEKGTSDAE